MTFSSIRFAGALFGVLASLLVCFDPAFSAGISAAQMKLFQQLPAAQQAEIIGKMTGKGKFSSAPAAALEVPQLVIPIPGPQVDSEKQAIPSPIESSMVPVFMSSGLDGRAVSSEHVGKAVQPKAEERGGGASQPLRTVLDRRLGAVGVRMLHGDISQFGYDLFAGAPTTFAPVTDVPVPPEYVLGPGDELRLQFYGSRDESLSVVVDREGLIDLPGVGPLVLAGQSFVEAKAFVSEQIRHRLIGVTASISMGRLRSIRVFVLGDVNHPGSYLVSGLSTLSNALFYSGGVSKQGSLRRIQLKRAGKIVSELDLYDFLLNGDSTADKRLQPGDVIFAPPIGATVGVAGEVGRPAIYELSGERTVAEVVDLAAGLLATADPAGIQLNRITDKGDRTLLDISRSQDGMATLVHPGDLLLVYPGPGVRTDVVELLGHVKRPGAYGWYEGLKLSDLLTSLDDLLPGAYIEFSLLKRVSPYTSRLDILQVFPGRLLVDGDSTADLFLQPDDVIYVFSQGAMEPLLPVRAIGELRYPGEVPFSDGMTVSDLVMAAGGPTEKAYLGEVEVTRYQVENGDKRTVSHLRINLSHALTGDSEHNIVLQPYDELIVRGISEWRESATVVLSGEVKFPGNYPIEEGEKLSNLIERAGGYTGKAYLPAAVFTRQSIRDVQQEQMVKMADRIEADISLKEAELGGIHNAQVLARKSQAVGTARQILKKARSVQANGRLVIEISALEELRGGEFDLSLKGGDHLHIPQRPDQVLIMGQTYNNTAIIFQKELRKKDYIHMAGGTTRFADTKHIYVVRANGQVDVGRQTKHIFPGDTIVVPEKIDRLHLLDSMLDWSQVLMNIGVGVASMKTIGVF